MTDIDYNDIRKLQQAMAQARRKLQEIVSTTGHALQIIEMDSDFRKRLLARYTKSYMNRPDGKVVSHAQAETFARADEAYGQELEEWAKSLEGAFTARKDWEATEARLEVARSLHSVAGHTIKRFQE